jgi:serine/threonine-protein kinase
VHGLLRELGAIYDLHTLLRRRRDRASYRATRRNDGLDVCIKMVYEPTQTAAQLLARMEREARLLQQTRNPDIAELLDFGSDDGASFLVTRWMNGVELRRWRLEAPRRERIHTFAASLLRTVALVHDAGIAHRDLHPGNILVRPRSDVACVIDFGLSRRFESGGRTELTATLQMLGSPRYISPEQTSGERTSGASDVFAVGCILWEVLAGSAPWDDPDPVSAALLRLQQPLASPRQVQPRITEGEYAILRDMLTIDPAARLSAASAARRWSDLNRRRRWLWPCGFPLGRRMY